MAKRPSFGALSLLSNRFPPLHGLRAFAIVSVLQIHLTNLLVAAHVAPERGWSLLSRGVWFGIDLFFVVSGFLIGTILLPSRSGQEPRGILRFYGRRTFRIVPLYYVVLTAIAFIRPLTHAQRANLVYEYAYLTNYLHDDQTAMPWAWSLAVEEHFYVAVPLLALVLARFEGPRKRLAILAALWVVPWALRSAIYFAHDGPWEMGALFPAFYSPTHTRFDTLVAGVALAYIQRFYGSAIRVQLQTRWRRWALLAIPATCVVLLMGAMRPLGTYAYVLAWGTVTSVMYVSLLLWALNTKGRVVRWLSSAHFLRFATLGYGIYLVHPMVLRRWVVPGVTILDRVTQLSPGMLWVVGLVALTGLSALVAYLLHLVVEKPALWLRDRIVP